MIERIYREVRGGSWYHYPDLLRASLRLRLAPVKRGNGLGFRLVVRIKDE